MASISLTIRVELEEGCELYSDEERMWFENEILVGDGNLLLHSNDIGDTIGTVKKVTNIKWLFPIKD